MNQLELEFRKEITRNMAGTWIPTIHVENHLNPGVPDMSYVMAGDDHETGWLELKAIKHAQTGNFKFTLEPSQHRWIEAHHQKVPVHLLLAAGDHCYLVAGEAHARFLKSITYGELLKCSITTFERSAMRSVLPRFLSKLTDRKRPHGT